MSFDILRKPKAAEILLALVRGGKGVRELQEAVGGSFSTINQRIRELQDANKITDEYMTGEEYGEIPAGKRLLNLTDSGRKLVDSLLEAGFLKLPLLMKLRHKWIILVLSILTRIRGRTRFMKLLFLLKFELGLRKGSFFRFKPWTYGPFSDELVNDLTELQDQELVQERPVPFRRREIREEKILFEYALSLEGQKIGLELLTDLPDSVAQKLEKLRPFNEMPLIGLLEHVYRNHPRFITRSRIVEEILGKVDPLSD